MFDPDEIRLEGDRVHRKKGLFNVEKNMLVICLDLPTDQIQYIYIYINIYFTKESMKTCLVSSFKC